MSDIIQAQITHYKDKFNTLIMEIENDPILKTIEGNHLAGILVQMKRQIDDYLESNRIIGDGISRG
jgi:hypothetical protein